MTRQLSLRERRRLRFVGYPLGALVTLIAAVLTFGTVRENGGGPWSAGLATFGVLCVLASLTPVIIESEY
jgi:hypothetical protein